MKLETLCGESFFTVAKNAKELAILHSANVNFDFNEVNCIVSKNTDLDLLYRYYCDAHIMEWICIGPDLLSEYEPETVKELANRRAIADKKRSDHNEQMRLKDEKQRSDFKEKTENIILELTDEAGFEKAKAKNVDPYGACIFEYATGWAKLMQAEIANGKELKDIASETSFQLGFLGITGFMYGAAVSVLSQHWKHGAELKQWHNAKYNHHGAGVVNPALLTVKA